MPKVVDGVAITIEQAWALFQAQRGKCALTGAQLAFSKTAIRRTAEQTASLDRIDSQRGYELGNVQWVHKTIQLMKNALGQDEFIAWCELVAQHNAKVKAA